MRIIEDAFASNVGRPAKNEEEVAQIVAVYLEYLVEEIEKTKEKYQILPGAMEIASVSAASGRCAVGLATGNVEKGARLKLDPAGLNGAFAFGGFGSDAMTRAELIRYAIDRGQAPAARVVGRRFLRREILVIGDTELDVEAARAVGALSVGVLAGSTKPEALEAAKPDLLVSSLAAPELWTAIGLKKP
jgi:phosphoglycolate phosphatase-like HAD superfamily hydrolase